MSTIWVIAPFDYEEPEKWQEVWENNLREGFISIGWAALGNVSKRSEAEIYNAHRKAWPKAKPKGASSDARVLVKFWNDIEVGQTVVARRGRKSIAAMGTVASKPYYSASKTKNVFRPFSAYPNHIDVVWDAEPRDVLFDRQVFGMQTIHTIGKAALDSLLLNSKSTGTNYPDEVDENEFPEGGVKKVLVNAYERDPKARAACLKHHGYRCKACDMMFAEEYGEIGIDYIHVHHIKPVASKKKRSMTDAKNDLVPVCPNCHAMLHRGTKLMTVSQLRKIIKRQRDC